jgi:hypothetical protein
MARPVPNHVATGAAGACGNPEGAANRRVSRLAGHLGRWQRGALPGARRNGQAAAAVVSYIISDM